MKLVLGALTVAWLVASNSQARAQQADDPPPQEPAPAPLHGLELAPLGGFDAGLAKISLHGFVSQGFILSFENNFLADSLQGSFEFTEVGLNVTTEPLEDLRLGMQLFARDLGPVGNFAARFDWFYADYHFTDAFGLRVGRTKLPFGLYNELNDIDVARAPILLPQSVYPITNRDFLLAQTGAEAYGLLHLGDAGHLDYRLYGGTVLLTAPTAAGPLEVAEVRWPYLVGGRLLWEAPLPGLRLGASVQALRVEADLRRAEYTLVTDAATGEARIEATSDAFEVAFPAILWVASAEYAAHELLLAAEYSRWHVRTESARPELFPSGRTTSERAYALVVWRVSEWLQPAVYYSVLFPDVENRRGRQSRQHDVALTLRFDLNSHWLLKLEGHYMNGTALVDSALNEEVSREELSTHWGVLLFKTTAYF
jgi:hypothetical protein